MKTSFAVTAYEEMSRGGPTILECISAAIDHPAIDEIVIVDDYSSDFEQLTEFLSDVPKVKLFRNSENLKVFGNKLSAVAHSTGDWVINCDSDNVFSKEIIDKVLSLELDPMTWYCPSFAKPMFDYREYIGSYNSNSMEALSNVGGLVECFLNTGNQTVNREKYMEVFGSYWNKRADLMLPNYLGIPETSRSLPRWHDVFNACDSIIFNSEWVNHGGTLEIVEGFEYEHYWTNGSDSNYNRAPVEKELLNSVLMGKLGKIPVPPPIRQPVRQPVRPVREQGRRPIRTGRLR